MVFEIDHPNVNINSMWFNWEKHPISHRRSYCYNIKTVAEFGVCETELTTPFLSILNINFGFCGPSCQTPNMRELYKHDYPRFQTYNRYQWEMEAIYHENYDADDDFSKYQ